MPTLDWIGKKKVVNHHLEVPFKVLKKSYTFSADGKAKDSENKIIHGDNLEALKSLLPEYEGKIDCIYIDPPYNTGNEGWIYNDNVNDPRIKKWLGEVVGKESEDFTRHDKWLCMMYPRLKLLHKLLSEKGAIFISIDDNEQSNLKLICDEIFGYNNYQGTIVRATGQTTGQDSSGLGSSFDYIFVYSKSVEFDFKGIPLTPHDLKRFENQDEKGFFAYDQLRKTGSHDRREDRPNLYYAIKDPDGNDLYPTGPTGYDSTWRFEKKSYLKAVEENLIYWKKTKKDGKEVWWPYVKYYAEGRTKRPSPLWTDLEGNKKASRDVREILGDSVKFDFPKPIELIERILQISTNKDSIILDSFAGSGTTAHTILNMNKKEGSNRHFILIEMMDYAESITSERVKRVIKGYNENEGTGGDFNYYELGEPLLINGLLNEKVDTTNIREYVWFTETHTKLNTEKSNDNEYYLGKHNEAGYWFFYKKNEETCLNYDFLSTMKTKADQYIIYADVCRLPENFLKEHNIVFKKIPREIQKF